MARHRLPPALSLLACDRVSPMLSGRVNVGTKLKDIMYHDLTVPILPYKPDSAKVKKIMQKSIWLLAFLPCLLWLRSLVNGATVLTSTSDLTRIAQPPRLNVSSGIPAGISVIDKERGAKIPETELLFRTVVWLMAKLSGAG